MEGNTLESLVIISRKENMKTLYSKDSKGELRVWSIYTEGPEVVVKHGKLNGKIQEKRYTAEGKNTGKSNETTAEQQAELEAEAKYVKQMKSGYFPTKEEALEFVEFTPMKAHNFNAYANKINYPCVVQPKLDGLRLMIDKHGQAWSKQGEPIELPSHWVGVKELAIKFGGLDGEVYAGLKNKGGLSLQRIVSAFRKPNEDTPKLQYWIYDIPVNKEYGHRDIMMTTDILLEKTDSVVVVDSRIVETSEEADLHYKYYCHAGFEGIMYRNLDGLYEFGKRSYNLIKRKPRQSAEAIVVSVEKDKNNWGVLDCKLENGVQFKCQMKVQAGDKNYREYENSLELVGKTIEFEYEDESDDGTPLKPVGVGIREVNKFNQPLY